MKRLPRTPVTNVVNLRPKITIFSERAVGLTTFVTTDQKSTRKTPSIDDVCNNTQEIGQQSQRARPLRCRWAAAGTGRTSRRCATHQHTRNHWCGGRRRDLPRCRWAAAEPGRASRERARPHPSSASAAGVEGAGGTGGHGRASRSTTPSRRLACGDLAGGRVPRRPEHQRRHKQHKAGRPPPTGTHSGRGLRRPEHPRGHTAPPQQATHNETRPRPVARPRPRHAHTAPLSKAARRRSAPFTTAPPAIRRSCPRDPRPRRGQPRGGRRGLGTGSRTRSRHPRCGRSGSTAGRHRARHTRRA